MIKAQLGEINAKIHTLSLDIEPVSSSLILEGGFLSLIWPVLNNNWGL